MRAPTDKVLAVSGAAAGAVTALALSVQANDGVTLLLALVRAVVCAPAGAALLFILRDALRRLVASQLGADVASRYEDLDTWAYLAALLTLTSAAGVQLVTPVWITIAVVFAAAQLYVIRRALPRSSANETTRILSPLFFLSGAAALIYQVVWQRTLYNHFGVNMESITIIVSIFMFGLGVGALVGGRLSRLPSQALPWIFIGSELGIAIFGAVSIPLIQRVGTMAELRSMPFIAVTIFALLAIPTLFMGMTLPVLVAYVERENASVERSVAHLYFVNTLGSAAACFLTVDVLFAFTGLRGSTIVAAACNAAVAALAAAYLSKRSA
jgi:hypothetical protein